jgi:hypothetical protein
VSFRSAIQLETALSRQPTLFGPSRTGLGKSPASMSLYIVARDKPMASVTAGERRIRSMGGLGVGTLVMVDNIFVNAPGLGSSTGGVRPVPYGLPEREPRLRVIEANGEAFGHLARGVHALGHVDHSKAENLLP